MMAKEYVIDLAQKGRHTFTSQEAQTALGASAHATKLALNRLAKQGEIAMPARGFYVIVPPEYRRLGSLPADQFIPALMAHLGLTYYVGLLSAAQYYGAAHHRPQEFQVFVEKNRRPISCGAVRVSFIARKNIADVPVQSFNTPRGTIRVSTPEATAIDLIGYHSHAGGMNQAATVLSELAESIDPEKLVSAAQTASIRWAQRLGYILEMTDNHALVEPLHALVSQNAKEYVDLLPGASRQNDHKSIRWKLYLNSELEVEI